MPDAMVTAGDMRHRASVQQDNGTERDAAGKRIEAWSEVAMRWVEIRPLSGRERWQAQQVEADVDSEIRMRGMSDLAPNWRLVVNGTRVYEILHVIRPLEVSAEVRLLCREVVV